MSRIRAHALLLATSVAALGTQLPAHAAVSGPFQSASSVSLRAQPAATIRDSLSLSLMGQSLDSAQLDWRTPQHRVAFDLPPADWVEDMTLHLSADPITGEGGDVLVRLNGGEPTRLGLSRRGFTAQLSLDPADLRGGRNILTLSMVKPNGKSAASCLTRADGGWDIDLSRSRLDTTLRAKSRSVFLSEVAALMARPTPKPLSVRIRSIGKDTDSAHALIAQGSALRAAQIPDFKLSGAADIEIVSGTRLALAGMLRDSALMDAEGPRIGVDTGRPLRLVITGDTDEQVQAGLSAFATHTLPNSRHRITTPQGLSLNPRLGGERPVAGRRARIGDMGGLDFSDNWGAGPDQVVFDVSDPTAASARIKLDIARADFLSPDSTLSVDLNGRSLATTALDTDRIKLDMVVPQGWLHGRANTLRVTPDLLPSADFAGGCAPSANAPGLRIAGNSIIDVRTPSPSPSTDLARLSGGAGLLTADLGADTHIVLPVVRGEREDALRILGQLAEAGGQALTAATYGTTDNPDRNLLALGRAPSGVDVGRNVKLAAATTTAGGVISLAPNGDRFVGLIAPTRGSSLGLVADLLTDGAWDNLSGGITTIDRRGSELVQMAAADPNPPTAGFAIPELRIADWHLPSVSFPAIELDSFASELSLQAETTVDTLRDSWSRVDIRVPLAKARDGLRGRYDAPRVVAVNTKASDKVSGLAYTLANDANRLSAGLSLKGLKAKWTRFQHRSARKAAQLRGTTGIKAPSAKSWGWGDRNMSFAAMLVMLAFSFSCLGLLNSEWNGR